MLDSGKTINKYKIIFNVWRCVRGSIYLQNKRASISQALAGLQALDFWITPPMAPGHTVLSIPKSWPVTVNPQISDDPDIPHHYHHKNC